jgi:hypothetical protein
MTEQHFTVSVSLDAQLTVKEVWPDGDAPEHPTAEDVAAAMRDYGTKGRTLSDWGLDDVDVEVWDKVGRATVWPSGSWS